MLEACEDGDKDSVGIGAEGASSMCPEVTDVDDFGVTVHGELVTSPARSPLVLVCRRADFSSSELPQANNMPADTNLFEY